MPDSIRSLGESSEYTEKLIKLIPIEIIGAFLSINGIVEAQADIKQNVLLITTLILLILTPIYLYYLFRVTNKMQIVVTTISFLVWVFSIGGPFESYEWYVPEYGSIVLILWSLIVPLFKYK